MSKLNSELLSIIVCPETGAALHQEQDELLTDAGENGPRYPIEDGIPLLLPPALREAARSGE